MNKHTAAIDIIGIDNVGRGWQGVLRETVPLVSWDAGAASQGRRLIRCSSRIPEGWLAGFPCESETGTRPEMVRCRRVKSTEMRGRTLGRTGGKFRA